MALRETSVNVSFECDFDEVDRLDGLVDSLVSDVVGSLGTVETNVSGVSDEFGDLATSAVRDISRVDRELDGLGDGNPIQPIINDVDGLGDESEQTRKSVKELGKEFVDALGSKAQSELDKIKSSVGELGKTLAGVLGAAGIAVGAGALIGSTTDINKAMNALSSQTGITGADLESMGESMKNLYSNNMGEDFGDIADSMAKVNQVLGLTGAELESATNSALTMRDTFDFDVAESMRAVNSLMDNFGMTAEEAYSMIAQGAQNGLNQNDDLLDTINEYSVQFSKLGFSSEDMFNSLASGVENGTWSVDKLGDAIKEFSVRAIDGSETTIAGFEAIGFGAVSSAEDIDKAEKSVSDLEKKLKYAELAQEGFNEKTSELTKMKSADQIAEYKRQLEEARGTLNKLQKSSDSTGMSATEMMNRFAEGGDEAKKAFKETVAGLIAIEDPVQRDLAGVSLFGTMWEDLGVSGIQALADLDGGISQTTDALDKINEVKYDDAGSALSSLGRTINVALADEVGGAVEKAKVYIEDFTAGINGAEGSTETTFGKLGNTVATVGKTISDVAAFTVANWDMIAPVLYVLIGVFALVKGAVLAYNIVLGVQKAIQIASTVASYAMAVAKGAEVAPTVAAAAAQWGLNAALLASPITWIIIGIIAIIAVIILIIAYFDEIVAAIKWLWNTVMEFIAPIRQWILDNIIQPIIDFFVGLWNKLVEIVTSIWTSIMAVIMPVITWIWDNLINPIITIWKKLFEISIVLIQVAIAKAYEILITIATWIYTNVTQPILKFFKGIWDGIVNVFSAVTSFFGSVFMASYNKIVSIFSKIIGFFTGLWEKVTSLFGSVGTKIGETVTKAFKSVVNKILGFAEKTINGFIKSINFAIDIINAIPGVDITKLTLLDIPELATGGVVDGETTATIGEAGAEAVVPLENNLGWLKKLSKMLFNSLVKQTAYSPEVQTDTAEQKESGNTIYVQSGAITIKVEGSGDSGDTANKVKEKIEEFFEELRNNNKPVFDY